MTISELLAQFANPETIKSLAFTHKLLAGLITTVLGIGITFLALITLQFLISWMARLVNRTAAAAPIKASQPAAAPPRSSATDEQKEHSEQKNDNELVAVITAVIAMKMKTTIDNIVIKNIKKIEDRSPLWNRAGIIEQMNTRL
ncbi:MAG: OadG family protein [Proteobacteria bacterium]|nr:OadG family protein [Pseudomonadota bacterium]